MTDYCVYCGEETGCHCEQLLTVIQGDCLEIMKSLADNSVDSIVTDPPYGLSFMGEEWDHEVPGVEYWKECLRVAKPGAYLVAFGGTRKYHRLMCAIEDAGWEIRDCLSWLYGQGFPKSLDVSKAIDKKLGATPKVVGTKLGQPGYSMVQDKGRSTYGQFTNPEVECSITKPSTDEAKKYEGWGTSLKPGWEPIILARKPLESTVADNVMEHGTGGLNIDATRIEGEPVPVNKLEQWSGFGQKERPEYTQTMNTKGRWPANVVLDEESSKQLDEQTGVLTSGVMKAGTTRKKSKGEGGYRGNFPDEATQTQTYGDSGGASRFFYCAKASKKEKQGSKHPTVKPLALMRWLCKLVTPPKGTILDPFAGSGTTGIAAVQENFAPILIELNPEYVEEIEARFSKLDKQGQND